MSRVNFDSDWHFSLEDRPESVENGYDYSSWRKIRVPHDWSVEHGYNREATTGPRGGFVASGVGYYKKVLFVSKEMLDQHVAIEFDGVYMNSQVYINGILLGKRPYGYISFSYELSQHLVEGLNIITVKVDNRDQESSRWYNGCGIYRHVWLRATGKIHVKQWGTYISTPRVNKSLAEVLIKTNVVNNTSEVDAKVEVKESIVDADGNIVSEAIKEAQLGQLNNEMESKISIQEPKLWTLESPHLYKCHTSIWHSGECMDTYETRFGIRKLEYISHKGFYLNGRNTKIKGVCLHHDAGVVGAALSDKINKKRLLLLKAMGCNAVRTSHHPFAPAFYDLCDELGIMVMDEIFDGWETLKATCDYGLYFDQWHEEDLTDFVKRDRNHPSVIMWSLGNEVTGMTTATSKSLSAIIRSLDDTRPITCGVNAGSDNSEANRAILDIAGYNDGGGACFLYDRDHETRPEQLFIATEAPHSYSTRGFYRTQTWWRDKNQARIEIDNLSDEELFYDGDLNFRSSYDNSGVRVGVRDSWNLSVERPFLLGEFRWTGYDYYGESYGWPARWCDSGVIGMEHCPKDPYYLYQSMWTTKPMVHLLPHWTHPTIELGTEIPVVVYSNCQEVELFINGRSLGKQSKSDSSKNEQHVWQVPYEVGKIEVLAYREGEIAASKFYETAGQASTIKVISDSEYLLFDGVDVAHIDVLICDDQGIRVPSGENIIGYAAYGEVEILGTENGCSIDTTPLYAHQRKAFNSLCMAVVRGKDTFKSRGNGGVIVASILGDIMFETSTKISVDVKSIALVESQSDQKAILSEHFQSYISLNGGEWQLYNKAIEISETTYVELKIIHDDNEVMTLTTTFIKGIREKVIDLIHGNKVLNLERPVGPFASQVQGQWSDGRDIYDFRSDGAFVRILGKGNEQHMGYWWYDFPSDPFEGQDYAGVGEVWFDSGERNKLELSSKDGHEIILDNTNIAIRTAYNAKENFVLKRL